MSAHPDVISEMANSKNRRPQQDEKLLIQFVFVDDKKTIWLLQYYSIVKAG